MQLSISREITDLTISQEETAFAYYKQDNSMAMQAHSQMDIHLHQEVYQFDITYSAEALGLTAKDFPSNKPMVLKYAYQQQEVNFSRVVSMQLVKRVREPQEVLSDLAKALSEVLRDNGNKSVSYMLDDEAFQAILGGGSEVLKYFTQLVMLMATINLSKKAGNSNNYMIQVSGKAKPLIEYQEKTNMESNLRSINFSITINPPGEQSTAPKTLASSVETGGLTQNRVTQPAVNVNVAA